MIPHFKVLETCLFTRVYISGFVCIPVTTSFTFNLSTKYGLLFGVFEIHNGYSRQL